MIIVYLPFTADLTEQFHSILSAQDTDSSAWAIWLDGGIPSPCLTNYINHDRTHQRYDIISAWPYKTIRSNLEKTIIQDITYNNKNNIVKKTFQETINKKIHPFDILQSILTNLNNQDNQPSSMVDEQPPFWHGILGYFGYDLNQLLYSKIIIQEDNKNIPILAVGVYSWALITDHKLKKTYIVYDEKMINSSNINNIIKLLNNKINNTQPSAIIKDFLKSKQSYINYSKNFDKIKNHIIDGQCYQINYSMLFTGHLDKTISSWQCYQYLRKLNPNPFSCYFKIDNNLAVLSFSPENFLKINNNLITTSPIKGTRKNYTDNSKLNNIAINDLLTNKKDRAENIMITDLMRNDLNKHSIPGSVKTIDICKLNSFPTVHHLISTIIGTKKPEFSSLDVFKGCFPGGSITGAPKIRAMEIIQQLENHHNNLYRYIYCGSIGYININDSLNMSIAIRTLLNYEDVYYYWAGSGIVHDSVCKNEYKEILNKLIRTY